MSGIRSITRAPSIKGYATAGSAPIYVKSTDSKLYFIPAGSGTTEVEIGSGQAGLTSPATFDLVLNTTSDNRQVELNSRNFTQATGDSIAAKANPSQTVTTTGAIYGLQISPRVQDGVAAAALVAVQGAPVFKGTTGTISGDVRAFEASIDLNDVSGTRTVSGTVSALYAFLQAPNGGTYTGGLAVLHVAAENTKKWDFLLKAEATNGFVVVGAGTYSTSDGYFLVRVGASTYRVPFFTAVD